MFCSRSSTQKGMFSRRSASTTPLWVIPFHNSALQGNIIAKFRFHNSISGGMYSHSLQILSHFRALLNEGLAMAKGVSDSVSGPVALWLYQMFRG